MAESRIEKVGLDAKVAMLEKQLVRLAARLRQAEAKLTAVIEAPIVLPLANLAPAPYEVVGQINILIQATEEGFTASYLDANLGASGDTKVEAYDGVKDRMITTYERLMIKPDEKLGPGLRRQKHVLASLIRRR
jgi:hypothetical protein